MNDEWMPEFIKRKPRLEEEDQLKLEPNGNSLDLLRKIYQNPGLALPVRMRAAIAALPHEAPRLAVTALVSDQSFAELLERRLKHLSQIENGNGAKAIEHQPVETSKPMPRIADRRYRRL